MENTQAERPNEQKKTSALSVMASRVSVDPAKLLSTLKDTVFKNATDSELIALVVVSNEYGLNPFLKEIYAFPGKAGGIIPVVSIDGWISMINRQPQYDGVKFSFEDKDGKPFSCTATIHIKGRTHPVEVTEYFEECFRNTEPWKTMPRRMLRHKALIQGGRVAFGFSGIQDEDEAQDTIKRANVREVEPAKAARPVFTEEPPALIEASAEPMQEQQPAAEPEPFIAETPQEKIAVALRDMSIAQGPFVLGLRKILPEISKSVTLVSQLPDAIAEQVITDGLDDILKLIREKGVKL